MTNHEYKICIRGDETLHIYPNYNRSLHGNVIYIQWGEGQHNSTKPMKCLEQATTWLSSSQSLKVEMKQNPMRQWLAIALEVWQIWKEEGTRGRGPRHWQIWLNCLKLFKPPLPGRPSYKASQLLVANQTCACIYILCETNGFGVAT